MSPDRKPSNSALRGLRFEVGFGDVARRVNVDGRLNLNSGGVWLVSNNLGGSKMHAQPLADALNALLESLPDD